MEEMATTQKEEIRVDLKQENAALLSENAQLKEQLQIHMRAINELKNVIVNLNVERMQGMKG